MKRTIGSGFEQLEHIVLCAGITVGGAGRDMVIRGTNGRDVVAIVESGGFVNVYDRGERVASVSASLVDDVIAYLYGGDDVLKAVTDDDVTAYAGTGDDLVITGAGDDTIVGGAGMDSVRGRTGSDTYDLRDRGKDRAFNVTRHDVLLGEEYSFSVWNRFLSTANVDAFRFDTGVVTREYLPGYGDDRVFYTVDARGADGYHEDINGLHRLAVGNPAGQSPGGARFYVPIDGGVRFAGFPPHDRRFVINVITVM